jgi:hypothetical protein
MCLYIRENIPLIVKMQTSFAKRRQQQFPFPASHALEYSIPPTEKLREGNQGEKIVMKHSNADMTDMSLIVSSWIFRPIVILHILSWHTFSKHRKCATRRKLAKIPEGTRGKWPLKFTKTTTSG